MKYEARQHKSSTLTFMLYAACLVVLLTGCAKPKPRVFFPPPPEQPRLEFIGNFSNAYDLKEEGFGKAISGVAGESYDVLVDQPSDIAGDASGKVFVATPLFGTVRVFDFANRRASTFDGGKAGFIRPFSLAVDARGRLFVGDLQTKKIHVFSPALQLLFSFAGEEVLGKPTRLAINDQLGRLYVADSQNHQIAVFDLNGKHLFSWGEKGAEEGKLHSPQGVAFDDRNHVFVADTLNARIQVFDAEGNFLNAFGVRSTGWFGAFESPKDLAFLSDGVLAVVDARKNALLLYTGEGDLLLALAWDQGKNTVHPLGFANPNGVWVDAADRIYISDLLNRRFDVWQYLTPGYLQANPVPPDWFKAK